MPDQPDLKVHDINVAHTTTFSTTGTGVPKTKVTYFIGNHGPFELEYDRANGTSAQIKSDIAAQVALLQDVNSLQG